MTSKDSSDFLGSGRFALVRRCYHKKLQNVVLKFFKMTDLKNIHQKLICHKAETLSQLKHKNVLQIYGVTQWKSYLGIVMEYAANGDLENIVLSKAYKCLSWPTRLRFYSEIAQGLDYLHNHDPKKTYIHGNLKLSKILLNTNLTVKIAGFEGVTIMEPYDTTTSISSFFNKFTCLYSPPELLTDPRITRTCSMDVYSYAMLGYEILTGQQVYSGSTSSASLILQLIMNRDLKPNMEFIDAMEKMLLHKADLDIFFLMKDIVIKCWATDPSSRPSINEVKTKLEAISVTYPDDIDETKHLIKNPIESKSPKVVLSQFEDLFISTIGWNESQDDEAFIDISVR